MLVPDILNETGIEMEEEAEEIVREAIVFLGPVFGHRGKRLITKTGNRTTVGDPKCIL